MIHIHHSIKLYIYTDEYGWDAETSVERAREQVANLINCDAKEIIFSTEMDYLAQLVRLEYVLSYSDREEWTPLALIDLPGRKSATIRFQNELATSPGSESKANQTLLF